MEDNIVEFELKNGIEEIKPQIQMNITRYIDLNYNQELFSLLGIFYHLNIYSICEKDTLMEIIKKMDDFSSILSLELLLEDENNINDFLLK
ncbi:hypothetical protein KEH51_15755 [[Brevibacterium] frigoritolerans]|uniref:Uncharacterized protein n=1 Tax=Peribacillus frigoritolerans TaxID=450367 RepID=A0A941FJF8_9BACI|nr:hypothetical protein [Peribacillus frigoritolerans]